MVTAATGKSRPARFTPQNGRLEPLVRGWARCSGNGTPGVRARGSNYLRPGPLRRRASNIPTNARSTARLPRASCSHRSRILRGPRCRRPGPRRPCRRLRCHRRRRFRRRRRRLHRCRRRSRRCRRRSRRCHRRRFRRRCHRHRRPRPRPDLPSTRRQRTRRQRTAPRRASPGSSSSRSPGRRLQRSDIHPKERTPRGSPRCRRRPDTYPSACTNRRHRTQGP